MTPNWIAARMEEINAAYKKCQEEMAIRTYLVSLKRMINEVSTMDFTEFYHYEKNILYHPMEVFSEQFLEQVENALAQNSDIEKRRVILDLEDSLVRVINVFKNIVDNSANSDRQIFTNLSVESSVYNLSPKYCHFYSQILIMLVKIFEGEGREYAFFLYPSIKYNTEFCRLLRYNDSDKRVLIIYLAESSMEAVDLIPMYLLHEAFHILTRKPRERKKRALALLQLMMCGLEQKLYGGLALEKTEKDQISEVCFDGILQKIDQYFNIDEENRFFYSNKIIDDLCDFFEEKVEKLVFETDAQIVCKYLEKREKQEKRGKKGKKWKKDVECELDHFNHMFPKMENFDEIRKRAFLLIKDDDIRKMLELFMRIFREGYADLALLMVLPFPEQYWKAFENSIRFERKDATIDMERNFRMQFAIEAISGINTREYDSVKDFWSSECKKASQKTFSLQSMENHDMIINGTMYDIFLEYFRGCSGQLRGVILEHSEEIENFREKMSNIMKSKEDAVYGILSGNYFGTIESSVS